MTQDTRKPNSLFVKRFSKREYTQFLFVTYTLFERAFNTTKNYPVKTDINPNLKFEFLNLNIMQ
jgi:hypothetical protein